MALEGSMFRGRQIKVFNLVNVYDSPLLLNRWCLKEQINPESVQLTAAVTVGVEEAIVVAVEEVTTDRAVVDSIAVAPELLMLRTKSNHCSLYP